MNVRRPLHEHDEQLPETTSPTRAPRLLSAPPPGGYAWWYFDAISDDGDYALTAIFFVGSVFSPSYAERVRRGVAAPADDHLGVNLALYHRGKQVAWVMSEYGASALGGLDAAGPHIAESRIVSQKRRRQLARGDSRAVGAVLGGAHRLGAPGGMHHRPRGRKQRGGRGGPHGARRARGRRRHAPRLAHDHAARCACGVTAAPTAKSESDVGGRRLPRRQLGGRPPGSRVRALELGALFRRAAQHRPLSAP